MEIVQKWKYLLLPYDAGVGLIELCFGHHVSTHHVWPHSGVQDLPEARAHHLFSTSFVQRNFVCNMELTPSRTPLSPSEIQQYISEPEMVVFREVRERDVIGYQAVAGCFVHHQGKLKTYAQDLTSSASPPLGSVFSLIRSDVQAHSPPHAMAPRPVHICKISQSDEVPRSLWLADMKYAETCQLQSMQPRTIPFAPHLESSWLPEPQHICHLAYQPGGRRACVMAKPYRLGYHTPPPPLPCPLRPQSSSSSLFHSLYLPNHTQH